MDRSPRLDVPVRATHRRRGAVAFGAAGWLLGLAVAGVLIWWAAEAVGRWSEADAAGAGAGLTASSAAAPPLPSDGGPFAAGTAQQAQHESRLVAEAFADCVFRKRAALQARAALVPGDPPPYGRCLRARSLGLVPGDVGRRGSHGPIDGRGARNELGVFTVHSEREAFLLQYDAAGQGWGFSFDADGQVAPVCRTPKARACWNAEDEPPGALFLGDLATPQVLAAVLRQGRAPR